MTPPGDVATFWDQGLPDVRSVPSPESKPSSAEQTLDDGWPADVPRPPSGDELPYDDGEPMESDRHATQLAMTRDYARVLLEGRDAYVAGNMGFYFSAKQPHKLEFKAPDIMVILGVENHMRKSWVVWEEGGHLPDVVIELLSDSTRTKDLGEKKNVYERLRIGDYFVYHPLTGEFAGWHFGQSGRYEPIEPDAAGRLRCKTLKVDVGLSDLPYDGCPGPWLRFFDDRGQVCPTRSELAMLHADAETQRADAEAQRADAETQRADAETQRADAEAQRADAETQRAQAEAQRAQAEAQRAQAEAQRADAAERELAALKAQLAALQQR